MTQHPTDVIILGPNLYPLNGITVHIKRVLERTKNRKLITTKHVPLSIRNPQLIFFIKLLVSESRTKIHLHNYHPIFLLESFLINTKKNKLIFTIHSEGIPTILEKGNAFYRFLILKFLRRCNIIICVNPSLAKRIYRFGIKRQQIVVLPAFIHPVYNREDINLLPPKIKEIRREENIILCANAGISDVMNYRIVYGLDLLQKLMRKLEKRKNIYLVLFLAIDRNLDKYGLTDFVAPNIKLFIGGRYDLTPVIASSDLFLRPTRTDGYSLSVAESLILGTPVIASDVVDRPEGTILFKTSDFEDFYDKVSNTISNLYEIKKMTHNNKIPDYYDDLLRIYKSNAFFE